MADKRAFIVEDHLDLAEIYVLTLQSLDYEAEVVGDGKDALDRLDTMTDKPELVILDMNLPQVSGHYIYKKLRSKPDWDHVPIIISTANTIVAGALEQELNARDHIIVKPISPSKLLELLRQVEQS